MPALTREQLLRPRRAVYPMPLPEFPDAPLLLAAPSGQLALDLREMRQRGVELNGKEGFTAILADMVADESGAPLLTREDVPSFLERLSAESLTALFLKFTELYAPKKQEGEAAPVPSKPSTSAA